MANAEDRNWCAGVCLGGHIFLVTDTRTGFPPLEKALPPLEPVVVDQVRTWVETCTFAFPSTAQRSMIPCTHPDCSCPLIGHHIL